ncbi:MAG: porin [Pseudomonadota bacterium]
MKTPLMSIRTLALLTPCFIPFSAALAQADTPWETELEAESVTVVTPLNNADAPFDVAPMLGEVSLIGTSERVLENGVRLRARGALRLQADHPQRPGGTGDFGSAAFAATGAFSGLSAAAPVDQSDIRTRLETAYFQIDGGYGELRLGKDQGVGARFHEGTKSVLSHARLDSTLLDPTGLSTIRTRHDLTGPSLKLSYASPRLLGLRGGISYTPKADADGLDRRPKAGAGGIAPETENAIELALNGTRRLRESGWRFDVGVAWSTADVSSPSLLVPYNRVDTLSGGTRIEKDDWTFGASWLESDNGLPDSDFVAWSVGLHREAYDTEFSMEFGQSEDDGAQLDSQSFRIGAAREIADSTRIALGYVTDWNETLGQTWESRGVVVEITLSQKIVGITGN